MYKTQKRHSANGNHKQTKKLQLIYHLFKEAQEPLRLGLTLLVVPLLFIGLLSEEIQDGIIFFLLFLGEGVGGLAMAEVEGSDICERLAAEVLAGDEVSTIS